MHDVIWKHRLKAAPEIWVHLVPAPAVIDAFLWPFKEQHCGSKSLFFSAQNYLLSLLSGQNEPISKNVPTTQTT